MSKYFLGKHQSLLITTLIAITISPIFIPTNVAGKTNTSGNKEQTDPRLEEAGELTKKAHKLYQQGRYKEAEPLYLQALEIRKKQLGTDHPKTANSLNNLAKLYKTQGRYQEAEPLYLQAIEIRKEQIKTEPLNLAYSLIELAIIYHL